MKSHCFFVIAGILIQNFSGNPDNQNHCLEIRGGTAGVMFVTTAMNAIT